MKHRFLLIAFIVLTLFGQIANAGKDEIVLSSRGTKRSLFDCNENKENEDTNVLKRAKTEEKGLESRAYRASLNHSLALDGWDDTYFTHIDEVHAQLGERLKIIKTSEKLERNIAIARASLIVEHEDMLSELIINLPYAYLSGRDRLENPIKIDDVTYTYRCFGDVVADEDNLDYIRSRVSKIMLVERDQTKLGMGAIKKTVKQLGVDSIHLSPDLSPKKLDQSPTLKKLRHSCCIPEHFSHSEQVLADDLLNRTSELLMSFMSLHETNYDSVDPAELLIHHLRIDICSSNGMCRKCANSLFRLSENGLNFREILTNCFSSRGYATPNSGVSFSTTASGLKNYDLPPKQTLIQEISMQGFRVHLDEHRVLHTLIKKK